MRESITVLPHKVNIVKRDRSNRWQAHIKLKNGKWERFSTGSSDEDEAREKALALYYGSDERAKSNLPQSTRKFRNVARYAADRLQKELDAGSGKSIYKDYIRVINDYLIPYFGNHNIDSINVKLLSDYAKSRDNKMRDAAWKKKVNAAKNHAKTPEEHKAALKIPKPSFQAKQSTINTHNSALNQVFDEALYRGWITESIKPTLLNKGVKSESRGAFTDEEFDQIQGCLHQWKITGHRLATRELREVLHYYVLFLANTGVRHGTETETLKWKNVSWYIAKGKRTAQGQQEESQRYLQIDIVSGKTGARPVIARDMLSLHLEKLIHMNPNIKQQSLNTVIKAKLDEPLFVTRSGLHVSTDALRGSFKQFLKYYGLEVGSDNKLRSLYSLRHTYCTQALLGGMSIHQLAIQVGNSVAMLEQFYSKLSSQHNAANHSGRALQHNPYAALRISEMDDE